MKGIIFIAFEEFVTANWGDEFFEDLLEATKLVTEEPFVSPGTYPDGDLLALVAETVGRLKVPLDDALHAFGRYAFAKLHAALGDHTVVAPDAMSLLAKVDSVIHVEVRKLYPEAETPRILFERTGPDTATLIYRSARNLCPVLVGLMDGLGDHYATHIEHEETQCARHGHPHCEFRLRFHAGGAADA